MPNSNSTHAHGQNKTYSIIVNGRQREVSSRQLSYSEVVSIAFQNDQPDPNVLYTVAYANPHGKDGTLAEGQDVHVKNGMSFNVSKTSRS
jgi:hypothetical protein